MAAHVPSISECQQALKDQGFDPGPIDNLGGHLTQAAILKFQAARGLPSTGQLDQQTVNALFPAPASNPLSNPIVQIGLELALPQLLKGIPMGNIFNVLSGAKTYITGVIMILVGAADYAGWNIPGTASWPAAGWIAAGVLAIAGRNAIATSVVSIIEKVGGVDTSKLPPAP